MRVTDGESEAGWQSNELERVLVNNPERQCEATGVLEGVEMTVEAEQ